MALIRRGVKRVSGGDKEEIVCAVCQQDRKFKGWDALLIHAERFVKENARQHRGYFRALKQALQEDESLDSDKKCHTDFGRKDVETTAPPCCSSGSPNQAGKSIIIPCLFCRPIF